MPDDIKITKPDLMKNHSEAVQKYRFSGEGTKIGYRLL